MFKILKQKKPLSKQIFYDSFNQKLKTLFDFNDDLRLEYEEFLNKFVLRNDECSLRTQCLFDVLQTFEKNFYEAYSTLVSADDPQRILSLMMFGQRAAPYVGERINPYA